MYGSNDEDGDEDEYEDGVWIRFDLRLNHMVTIELRLHQLVAAEVRTAMFCWAPYDLSPVKIDLC